MRQFYLYLVLAGTLILGACSSSASLTGPADDTRSGAVLHGGGQDAGSNNKCTGC